MFKKGMGILAALLVLILTATAMAETGTAYGVYQMAGEHPDSLISVTLTCEDGKITAASIDEKLLPVAMGGAAGWCELTEETAALLDGAVISANGKTFPASFSIDGIVWTGTEGGELGMTYTAQVNGADVTFMDYVLTDEGGAWYFAQTVAQLLKADGSEAASVELGTKASTGHGVAFWPSELKFPGNIAAIEAYLVANGTDYDLSTVAMGENGWTVADTVTGATLAGTPNYLRIAQEAYAKVK